MDLLTASRNLLEKCDRVTESKMAYSVARLTNASLVEMDDTEKRLRDDLREVEEASEELRPLVNPKLEVVK